jgi:transposase
MVKQVEFLLEIEKIPEEKRVYLDESAVKEQMRTHGRASAGEAVSDKISGKKLEKENVISAICQNKFIAPMVFRGSMNGDLFYGWVETVLIPEFKQNQVVIMDNATYHHNSMVKELFEEAGIRILYLPPYSPELNPIEPFWANVKKYIRKLANSILSFQEKIDTAIKAYC